MYYVYALRIMHTTWAHHKGVKKAGRMDGPRFRTTIEMARDAEQIMAAFVPA